MEEKSEWELRVENCGDQTLIELYYILRGSEDKVDIQRRIGVQKALIRRAREEKGATTKEIINRLVDGKPNRERKDIAKEWCEAFGISEKEFKKIASE